LARPEGNPPGGRGLALFYIELRDEHGRLRNIQINRLKDKLGTRKVPTAELTLAGTPAQLVKESSDGVRNITPLLNITRLWNGISAVSLMRRGLALAFDYAHKRVAFGSPLAQKPLHMDTLAGLQAEFEAAFHLAFYVAELTGRAETANEGLIASTVRGIDRVASDVRSDKYRTGSGSDPVEDSTINAAVNRVERSSVRTVSGSDRSRIQRLMQLLTESNDRLSEPSAVSIGPVMQLSQQAGQ
jgi:alkylation response protein AidB-like acyl-CoA dehydrogenase